MLCVLCFIKPRGQINKIMSTIIIIKMTPWLSCKVRGGGTSCLLYCFNAFLYKTWWVWILLFTSDDVSFSSFRFNMFEFFYFPANKMIKRWNTEFFFADFYSWRVKKRLWNTILDIHVNFFGLWWKCFGAVTSKMLFF